jgi:TPR repeat protein
LHRTARAAHCENEMVRIRIALFALTLAGASSLSGCGYILSWCRHEDKEPKAAAPTTSEYDRLAAKAHKGDIQAARQLVKWCYQNDADNERAKYWLKVAAENGDSSSAKAADYVQDWR